jgi:hypothetical protein
MLIVVNRCGFSFETKHMIVAKINKAGAFAASGFIYFASSGAGRIIFLSGSRVTSFALQHR